MANSYYIASCVFTSLFPQLSLKIQQYIKSSYQMPIVRCCFPNYRLKDFEDKMPAGVIRDSWAALPDCAPFAAGDTVYSLCHNCSNIIEETHPDVKVKSLWELILEDKDFPFPDYTGMKVTVQDCWRAHERGTEQEAVRKLLEKMNIDYVEIPQNKENTRYCGSSLLRPQPPRNPKVAPRHYVTEAKGLFIPHTKEEQIRQMKEYCSNFKTETVVCYCHYCLEGLIEGEKDGRHIAQLLFG